MVHKTNGKKLKFRGKAEKYFGFYNQKHTEDQKSTSKTQVYNYSDGKCGKWQMIDIQQLTPDRCFFHKIDE